MCFIYFCSQFFHNFSSMGLSGSPNRTGFPTGCGRTADGPVHYNNQSKKISDWRSGGTSACICKKNKQTRNCFAIIS